MNKNELTLDEQLAWMRMQNPTGIWNKYDKVRTNKLDGLVYCDYHVSDLHGGTDVDFDSFTKDERCKMCGFTDFAHYKEVKQWKDDHLKFEDLKQGMCVFSETLRNRYIIGSHKDKNTVYATQQQTSGRFGKKKTYLSKDEVDTGFFKKSKTVEQINEAKEQIISDMDHSREEFATE